MDSYSPGIDGCRTLLSTLHQQCNVDSLNTSFLILRSSSWQRSRSYPRFKSSYLTLRIRTLDDSLSSRSRNPSPKTLVAGQFVIQSRADSRIIDLGSPVSTRSTCTTLKQHDSLSDQRSHSCICWHDLFSMYLIDFWLFQVEYPASKAIKPH